MNYAKPPFIDYYFGLDLGKNVDFTCLSLLERSGPPGGHAYDVVSILRASGTMYPQQVEATKKVLADPRLRPQRQYGDGADVKLEWAPPPAIAIDATGVGVPVVDMFLTAGLAARAVPITIVGGDAAARDTWTGSGSVLAYRVSKGRLISTVQMLLQSQRLRISPELDLAPVLQKELFAFTTKITLSANETYGSNNRERTHDDIVLSIALAAWLAENDRPAEIGTIPNPMAGRQWGVEESRARIPARPWGT